VLPAAILLIGNSKNINISEEHQKVFFSEVNISDKQHKYVFFRHVPYYELVTVHTVCYVTASFIEI
jgi:hypothetical protein